MSWPSTVTVPRARIDDAADDADQRRLAGAVRAEQREDLAAPDLEVDVLQRLEAGRVGLRQVGDGDDGLHGADGAEDRAAAGQPAGAGRCSVYMGRRPPPSKRWRGQHPTSTADSRPDSVAGSFRSSLVVLRRTSRTSVRRFVTIGRSVGLAWRQAAPPASARAVRSEAADSPAAAHAGRADDLARHGPQRQAYRDRDDGHRGGTRQRRIRI